MRSKTTRLSLAVSLTWLPSDTTPSAVSFRMAWDVEEPVFITYTTAFVFSPILEPFGKIPANVVTEASIHNLMSSGVLFILIFHISQRPRPWVEILMWGWVWKKNMPRKTSENPEALLHTHKESIGWPRLGGVCSNSQTAWQEETQMQIGTIRVVKKKKCCKS